MPRYPKLTIGLPEWVAALMATMPAAITTNEEQMDLAIRLARESTERGGGPFGAVVVEQDGGRIVAPGVNLVVPLRSSLAHAEIVAISIAQQLAGTYDLDAPGLPALQLVTSTEPCAMCLGAIPWSGVSSVVCGATAHDAEGIGFDEGAKPSDWPATLARRGIAVVRGVRREQAAAVLAEYARRGGRIYN
jgi:tRNA(Arg) A34 adenosine deaminase TadA